MLSLVISVSCPMNYLCYRFHLGEVQEAVCGRDAALVFGDVIASGISRFVETRSIGVGPSSMMQFDLTIRCGDSLPEDTANTVSL